MADETHQVTLPESNSMKTEESIEASEEELAKSQELMKAVASGIEAKLLLSYGHPWNVVDDDYKSVGDYAKSFGHDDIYDFLLEEGVRAELLLGLMQRKLKAELLEADEDEDGEEQAADQSNAKAPAPNADYLAQKLHYTEDGDRLLDAEKNGVMMGWELPLMIRHAEVIAPKEGLRVLNVGFGLGLIDKELQKRKPAQHTIIEAHPDVYAHMIKEGWDKKPGVKILFGRWQDVVDQLEVYDGIFFDTFGEYYEDLREFHEIVPNHLEEGGIYSYFSGLGADNAFFHAVYNRISELELTEMGFSVEFEEMDVGLKEEEWNGIKRAYWTLDKYYLPICRLEGF
ncbi:hypothetical protein BGW41_000540 [Actinomortierella wolfii]|nr:hypothetical protein BGW41_000540 [Actinomortierella wolfii]